MQESYIPWLWTLSELVEKNHVNMFDIKLTLWAEHMLGKIKLIAENMTDNRKKYILEPIISYLNTVFTENNYLKYNTPSDNIIRTFADKFMVDNVDSFPIAKEINSNNSTIYVLSIILNFSLSIYVTEENDLTNYFTLISSPSSVFIDIDIF